MLYLSGCRSQVGEQRPISRNSRFYALGIGPAFADPRARLPERSRLASFLCPRDRDGVCSGSACYQFAAGRHVSMPSVSGWRLQAGGCTGAVMGRATVSMPSVSGWCLQLVKVAEVTEHDAFLCPRYRAGVCSIATDTDVPSEFVFLCPRYRAGVCSGSVPFSSQGVYDPFLCPRYRAGVCSRGIQAEGDELPKDVSMPSVSG